VRRGGKASGDRGKKRKAKGRKMENWLNSSLWWQKKDLPLSEERKGGILSRFNRGGLGAGGGKTGEGEKIQETVGGKT